MVEGYFAAPERELIASFMFIHLAGATGISPVPSAGGRPSFGPLKEQMLERRRRSVVKS
jgi:hypothetical protein